MHSAFEKRADLLTLPWRAACGHTRTVMSALDVRAQPTGDADDDA
jgi:hypothetical protein